MSGEIETELRTAFQAASQAVMPHPDLADQVRRAARRRRIRVVIANSPAVIALAAGTAYLAGDLVHRILRPPPVVTHHTLKPNAETRLLIPMASGQGVDGLAVSGSTLYVATEYGGNSPYMLAAYNRVTGQFISRASVPAEPVEVRAGPARSVWLTFSPDQDGGPCGTWLLSADLRQRSATTRICGPIVPTGPETAIAVIQNGQLATLHMPPPGEAGQATTEPFANVGRPVAVSSLTLTSGKVIALVSNGDYANRWWVVVAGHPRLSFGGSPEQEVQSVAASEHGLWVITAPLSSPDHTGPLVRLSRTLRAIMPRSRFPAEPVLRRSRSGPPAARYG